MKALEDSILLSATDLMRFTGCAHATTLDLAYLRGNGPTPREDSEDSALLQAKGDAHEASHLQHLKDTHNSVVEIERGQLGENARATREALSNGPAIIFQGAFLSGNWGGWSDFLERVERPSALGSFSYEVADTKLKRRPHPKHVLQLVLYSDMLGEAQGILPEFAHIELGDGTRATLRLAEYSAYARRTRDKLEAFIKAPPETRPLPCADCSLCRWGNHCAEVWKTEDSLFNVANITRGQVKKLEAAGVRTMEVLASHGEPIRGMAEPTRKRLVTQARLQHARKSGEPSYELREPSPGKGFDLLPEQNSGDLFYDIEGNPHHEGGLEYLQGIWFDDQFRAIWAHDHAAEAKALRELLGFFRARIQEYPGARIYHYAPYEITALKRLTTRYGVGEAYLDRLLREHRFVDLFAVVRGALIGSEDNYSIKSMEVFYGRAREGGVTTAGDSVVAYERWCETGEQKILEEIKEYNRIDCISTQELRDWLVSIRPDWPWPIFEVDAGDKEVEEDAETEALRTELAASTHSVEQQEVLFNLGIFHKRESKPAQWAVFDSVGKEEDELIDDLEALAGLDAVGPPEPVKRSMLRTYRFPAQETKLRSGKKATVPVFGGPPATVNIESLDRSRREVTVKVGNARADLLRDRLTLHPDWPLRTDVIAAAIRGVIADQCGRKKYTAITDLLARAAPRLSGAPRSDILGESDLVEGTISAVNAMDATVLPIQGPPGTGKTYVTAQSIVSLLKSGKRIGVASNSHEAIRNVLSACVAALQEEDRSSDYKLVHKVSSDDDGYSDDGDVIRTKDNDYASDTGNVVGGTVFFFARQENVQSFDWLFVDEAGQVSLANLVAMGRAARNIVLVGDPRQLPQVIQGAHPYPANLSCLEWLLGDQATIPPDRGIFLPISRRMHPEVCRFISEQMYEGRLTNHPGTANQRVRRTKLPEAGAFWVPVEHEGNSQVSTEEIDAIHSAINELLLGTWTEKDGSTRPITETDIIVVAPYNAQVNALREALSAAVRVGTVDKFQGQEAPICLVSMTASSTEEMPRGMEFLFSLNRINVAVSRAKALAIVFGSPRLLEATCETIEQMRQVNTLCALSELGDKHDDLARG